MLDTSVIVDLETIDPDLLPDEPALSAITLAELTVGPHAAKDGAERTARQLVVQTAEATFEAISFNANTARAYGAVYAAVAATGRKAQGRRMADLFTAATALAESLPLYTRNPADLAGLEGLIQIVTI
ncbi:MAG TPA: PIN domain-containing protein [Chloroflexota bacterium]|jgi:hypothetical protein|nr:PIN domain-containing protein [Chloroflexota bacterium]